MAIRVDSLPRNVLCNVRSPPLLPQDRSPLHRHLALSTLIDAVRFPSDPVKGLTGRRRALAGSPEGPLSSPPAALLTVCALGWERDLAQAILTDDVFALPGHWTG